MLTKTLSLLAALVLAVSFVFSPEGLPIIPICWFKNMTGLPCAGCGLSHAVCAISHGRLADAWGYHPFSFLVYPALVVFLLGPLIVWKIPKAEAWMFRSPVGRVAPVVFVAALLMFGICRLVSLAR